MNEAEYEELCRNAESLANSNPTGYRNKLRAFSLLGYLVIFGILACLIAILAGTGYAAIYSTGLFLLLVKKKVIFVLIPLTWILLRALWIKFEQPQGYQLKRDAFPSLFAELDNMQQTLNTPKIHQVLLTPEFNASICQTPRLGIFGWQHNTLTLGLELLMAMSPTQAKAVIAHELGHLSGSHSAFSARMYRARMSWQRIMEAFGDNDSWGAKLMHKFFYWYAPRFSAYSFALARSNEFEADAVAAELTSKTAAASALVAAHTKAAHLDETYWSSVFGRADTTQQPDVSPWHQLPAFLNTSSKQDYSTRLQTALSYSSDYTDTHPSLTERLAALGVEPSAAKPVEENAASSWLAGKLDKVLQDFDNNWLEDNQRAWQDRYQYVQSSQAEIDSLAALKTSDMSDEQLWRRVALSLEFKTAEESRPAIDDYAERHPDDTALRFVRGRFLCEQNDERGLVDLKAATVDREIAINACQVAYQFLRSNDRKLEAEEWREIAEEIATENHQLYLQHTELTDKDELRPTELPESVRSEIINALASCKMVKEAYIAEKDIDSNGSASTLALAIVCPIQIFGSEESINNKLQQALPQFEGWIVPKLGTTKKLAKKIIKAGEKLI